MPADEGRIRDDLAVILDIRKLALGSLVEAARIHRVGEPGHLQQHLRLGHEGARVGQAKCRSKAIERDHVLPSCSKRDGTAILAAFDVRRRAAPSKSACQSCEARYARRRMARHPKLKA